ncbi:hypothetical protein NA57DRAFT_77514 [Rhizodiscina lignyota]|uniref:Uncharacterized protein n=1 Tax=Rhizodiscina lignyota TaxID=1504668 RepID=A0A9P4IDH3_9PEZI|nr:hypothetical protein NA57DRAFT_77514 [Rhizodiscina lignyota]
MAASKRPSFLLICFIFLNLTALSLAAYLGASSAFCKCTCFGNSTIIDLIGGTTTSPSSSEKNKKFDKTCNDCTKKLCLDYHLPICKGAEDEDVFTQCFWRDSAKDQAVVFIFIFATVGLLIYAGIKPWIDNWIEKYRERRQYIPISGQGNQ